MNATELQTRLQNFTNRIVVLCGSLPSDNTPLIIKGHLPQAPFSVSRNDTTTRTPAPANPLKMKLNIAFIETGETLFRLASIVDLKLIPPSKLSSILAGADELTAILAWPGIAVEKKSKHK